MTTAATTTITHIKAVRRPSDIDDALDWLAHGAELARDLKGDRATHRDVIWQLLIESVETIDKTPDQERRWLTSGKRSNWTLSTGMSHTELAALERNRVLSAMKPFDGQATCLPRRDEGRAMGVLEWMRWVRAAKSGDRLSKAAVALARGADSEIVQRIYCPGRKPSAQNVFEVKTRTVGFILTGLKNDLGIVPADGISFHRQ
ncbi:hypothetical protein [Bradyrhizobium sp. 76]|uniref:hypothetical protein n=1 Tax=Bradyrhizobium sp. 76 TaxID=2782680 RepID=UPI001FF7D2E6|nr:hypothetical protein [Bradyrhizobium sp. 76]MCK1410194.1 hypothetical protein [Bradyrhizobium sp. 76]